METEIRENTATKESWSVVHPLSREDSCDDRPEIGSGRHERQARRSRCPWSV